MLKKNPQEGPRTVQKECHWIVLSDKPDADLEEMSSLMRLILIGEKKVLNSSCFPSLIFQGQREKGGEGGEPG